MKKEARKLWVVTKREYGEWIRSRWFLISTIFAPAVFALLIAGPIYMFDGSNSKTDSELEDYRVALYNVNVLDATTTGFGERVAQLIGGGKYANQPMPLVRITPVEQLAQAESTAIRETKSERISGYVIVDSNTLNTGNAFYAGRKANSLQDIQFIKNSIKEALIGYRLESRGLSPQEIDSITLSNPQISVNAISATPNITLADSKILLATLITILLYTCIVVYGQSILTSVVEEKTTRISEVILSSIKPGTLLAGKIIGVTAVGLTQQLIWIAMGLVVAFFLSSSSTATALGVDMQAILSNSISIPILITFGFYFLLGVVFYGSISAAVGSMVNSESDARHAGQPIIMLLVASMLCFQPLISDPDSGLSVALTLIPFSSPILMPLRVAISDVSINQILLSLCILLVSCIATVKIAAKIYRIGLLMHGKRLSFKDLKQALQHQHI